MMINQVQSSSDAFDYDIPPSTCGYPIYFSLCVDGQFDRPTNSSLRSFNPSSQQQSSSTLPLPSKNPTCFNNNNSSNNNNNTINCNNICFDDRFRTLPVNNNGLRIPNRSVNCSDQLSYPIMSQCGDAYDVPQPHPRYNSSFPKPSSANHGAIGLSQTKIESNNYDTPVPRTGKTINNRFIQRSGSQDFPKNDLVNRVNGISINNNLKPDNFGSTNSLPSPISDQSSLEASVSLSSCDNTSNRSSLNQSTSETYDTPSNRDFKSPSSSRSGSDCGTLTSKTTGHKLMRFPAAQEFNYDIPPLSIGNQLKTSGAETCYDVPKSTNSRANEPPRGQLTHPIKAITVLTRSKSSSVDSLRDPNTHGLDLSFESALTLVNRLETESLTAIGKLLDLSSKPAWRKRENLELKLKELEKCCQLLKCVIRETEVFADGVYVNSLRYLGSSSLNKKLYRLAGQLKDSSTIVSSTIRRLDSRGWTLTELSASSESAYKTHDELDQLIACLPGLREDIKHIISLVKSSGKCLFPEKIGDKPNITIGQQHQHSSNSPSTQATLNTVATTPISNLTAKPGLTSKNVTNSKPPPPPVPPKPKIQSRPLPLVPKECDKEDEVDKARADLANKLSLVGCQPGRQIEEDEEDDDYASLETRDQITRRNILNSNLSLSVLTSSPSSNQVFYNQLIDYEGSNRSTGNNSGGGSEPGLDQGNQSNNNRLDNNNIGPGLGSSSNITEHHSQVLLSKEDQRLFEEQIFSFYCPLLEEENQSLRQSVNALIAAINGKQMPKSLINLSKLIVISGQKMIFISDTISRNVSGEISLHVAKCANSLCDSLKNLITFTKKAANLFPSTPAMQDLLDSIVQVSIHSDQLTLIKESTLLN